ncbi:MAG: hypothetical protein ACXABI_08260 [Candidatus Hodarchaeales archaeon]
MINTVPTLIYMLKSLPKYITRKDIENIIDEIHFAHPSLEFKIKQWEKPYTLYIRDNSQSKLVILKEQTPREVAKKLVQVLESETPIFQEED